MLIALVWIVAALLAQPPALDFECFRTRVRPFSSPNAPATHAVTPVIRTLTPDGTTADVTIAGPNWVAAIDIASMKQVAKIPVGYVPKRNATAILP